jgi:hypothetical protein
MAFRPRRRHSWFSRRESLPPRHRHASWRPGHRALLLCCVAPIIAPASKLSRPNPSKVDSECIVGSRWPASIGACATGAARAKTRADPQWIMCCAREVTGPPAPERRHFRDISQTSFDNLAGSFRVSLSLHSKNKVLGVPSDCPHEPGHPTWSRHPVDPTGFGCVCGPACRAQRRRGALTATSCQIGGSGTLRAFRAPAQAH